MIIHIIIKVLHLVTLMIRPQITSNHLDWLLLQEHFRSVFTPCIFIISSIDKLLIEFDVSLLNLTMSVIWQELTGCLLLFHKSWFSLILTSLMEIKCATLLCSRFQAHLVNYICQCHQVSSAAFAWFFIDSVLPICGYHGLGTVVIVTGSAVITTDGTSSILSFVAYNNSVITPLITVPHNSYKKSKTLLPLLGSISKNFKTKTGYKHGVQCSYFLLAILHFSSNSCLSNQWYFAYGRLIETPLS